MEAINHIVLSVYSTICIARAKPHYIVGLIFYVNCGLRTHRLHAGLAESHGKDFRAGMLCSLPTLHVKWPSRRAALSCVGANITKLGKRERRRHCCKKACGYHGVKRTSLCS